MLALQICGPNVSFNIGWSNRAWKKLIYMIRQDKKKSYRVQKALQGTDGHAWRLTLTHWCQLEHRHIGTRHGCNEFTVN